jgi:hypothetical protein
MLHRFGPVLKSWYKYKTGRCINAQSDSNGLSYHFVFVKTINLKHYGGIPQIRGLEWVGNQMTRTSIQVTEFSWMFLQLLITINQQGLPK